VFLVHLCQNGQYQLQSNFVDFPEKICV